MQSKSIIYAAILWTLLFALMSFYWAAGGMVGVRSLGRNIQAGACTRSGICTYRLGDRVCQAWWSRSAMDAIKGNRNAKFPEWSVWIIALAGIFMILYGLLNFITISLAAMHVLDFDLDAYAMTWRLIFWEPFWILGGVLYVWSVNTTQITIVDIKHFRHLSFVCTTNSN